MTRLIIPALVALLVSGPAWAEGLLPGIGEKRHQRSCEDTASLIQLSQNIINRLMEEGTKPLNNKEGIFLKLKVEYANLANLTTVYRNLKCEEVLK